ncbi:unnamed protein product, partial [marine sediment metagenome]
DAKEGQARLDKAGDSEKLRKSVIFRRPLMVSQLL